MSDDAALLERWRAGDASAGQALLRRHFRSVYAFFANKVSHSADDMIQETFRACVEARDRIEDGTSFRAYLLTIARRELYRSYRKAAVVVEFDPSQVSVEQLIASPTALIARDQNQQMLLRALRRLPLELQLVLELTYWEQLPSHETAVVLEVPTGTVKSRLRRAREALREQLTILATARGLTAESLGDLDRWVESVREELAMRSPGSARDG